MILRITVVNGKPNGSPLGARQGIFLIPNSTGHILPNAL